MKINFLLLNAYGMGGTVRTVVTLANCLVEKEYDVNIISAFKYENEAHFDIDSRINIEFITDYTVKQELSAEDYELVLKYSDMIIKDDELYEEFNGLSDKKMMEKLNAIKGEILITTRASFNIMAAKYAPKEVIVIGQEHMNLWAHSEELKSKIKESYGGLDYLITLTDADTKDYEEFLKGAGVSIRRITNGIPNYNDGVAKLEEKVIVAAGRIVEEKGFEYLVCAYNILKDKHPDWKVKIYGKGPLKEALGKLIREIGLGDRILLMDESKEMQKEFKQASIYALSSKYEGFGMVIIEAMQVGLPVVSFNCPKGPAEIIEHGIDGILVQHEDILGLAQALDYLMDDIDERKRIGGNAVESVKKYSIDEVVKDWERLFEEIKNN